MTAPEFQPRNRPPADSERRELRRFFRDARRRLPARAQADHAEAVARHFFTGTLALRGRTVAAYLSLDRDGELSTAPLLARLRRTRKRLALPVIGRSGVMDMYRFQADTPLLANRFGILEPAPGAAYVSPLSVDVLLLPLVAFDRSGVRLGMGAGYYDRYLGRIPASMRPRLVGLAHEVQRSPDPLPFAQWDVPLDGVITERGWEPFAS